MRSKEVDQYIEKFDGEKKAILKRLRTIILKTFPKLKEEMKMGVPWYGGFFYLVALKDHVNMGFCFGGSLKKHEKELEGSGKYMRHVKIHSLKGIDEKKIVRLMKATDKTYKGCHKKKVVK
ncbi:hypothetical protein ES703_26056 [subsurface metagenome]